MLAIPGEVISYHAAFFMLLLMNLDSYIVVYIKFYIL